MADYSKMSDPEINIMVSKSLYGELSNWHKGELNEGVVDYCNNPSDAWPIICKSLISISPHYKFTDESEEYISHSNKWVADNVMSDGKSFRYKDTNPLRAAMIVYLMMKESENGI